MSWIDALILGIIQGLTEFLPVSSSGHLELGKAILGDQSVPEESMLFTVMVHGATALSTIVVFRRDIFQIIREVFQFQWNESTRFVALIIVSMIPAAFVGLFFEDELDLLFEGNLVLVGAMLLITAILLLLADRAQNTDKKVGWFSAFIVGVSQAIAILPGVSRSGATISTSVLLGIDRGRAARFSFLMVVPLILGKMILDVKDLFSGEVVVSSDQSFALIIAFVAAFVSGLIACTWMISLVKKAKLYYFSIYCAIVGVVAIAVSL
jgi:undecaprenyl-diphosphatase